MVDRYIRLYKAIKAMSKDELNVVFKELLDLMHQAHDKRMELDQNG